MVSVALNDVFVLYIVNHAITTRNLELAERYEYALPEIENEALEYATELKASESMGFIRRMGKEKAWRYS